MSSMKQTEQEFKEADWKLFRKKVGGWQEAYMKQLNEEYLQILKQDKLPSEKFWELEKRIYHDKQHPGVILDMRRSTMISNILNLLYEQIIHIDDLSEFSDVMKDTIHSYLTFVSRNSNG